MVPADAGPSGQVVSLLKKRGVRSLDMVVVSHHHADHYGGMEAVIREFRPRLFLATNSSHTTPPSATASKSTSPASSPKPTAPSLTASPSPSSTATSPTPTPSH